MRLRLPSMACRSTRSPGRTGSLAINLGVRFCWSRPLARCGGLWSSLDTLSLIKNNLALIEVRQTDIYAAWFAGLRDRQARARITTRIRRLSLGNPGDVKPVGNGVSEMRIDYGPGYRGYFVRRGDTLVVLLCGADNTGPGPHHTPCPRTVPGD